MLLMEQVQEVKVSKDPLAFYWVHRPVGTRKYIQYVLPNQQVPDVHSGELYGPFTRRSLKAFFEEKCIIAQKEPEYYE